MNENLTTNLPLIKGNTLSFTVEIDGLKEDLTAAYFTIKKTYEDETFIVQKKLNAGITLDKTTETGKEYKVVVEPADTKDLEVGNYVYDLQLEKGEEVFTPLIGILFLSPSVTVPNKKRV